MTLVYLTLAWAVGIVLGTRAKPDAVWFLLAGGLIGLAGAWWLRRQPTQRVLWLCLALGAFGALRMQIASAPPGPDSIAYYNRQGWSVFEGTIVAEPDVRDTLVNLRVEVSRVLAGDDTGTPASGLALLQAPRYGEYIYGDLIRFSGTPLEPPEFDGFSYQDYLAREGIYTLVPNAEVEVLDHGHGSPLMAALLAVKQRAQRLIASVLPEPQASLLTGILLGNETGIAADVRDAFNATGTSHVIAISGFNMTLLAGLIGRLMALILPRRRWLAFWLSTATIGLYTLFVGADPGVVRAAIMSTLLIAAPLFRRRTYVPASLACAALLMSLADPYMLWDVGFQLSFAAVLGLALFTDPLERGLRNLLSRRLDPGRTETALRLLSEPLVVSLAAQIATLPLILYYFGRLSLASLIVNALILPVQTPILILGGAATLIGLIVPALGVPFYWSAWVFLAWTIGVVRAIAVLPWASLAVQLDALPVIVFYIGLAIGMILQGTRPGWLGKLRQGMKTRRLGVAALGAGALAAVLIWLAVLALPDGRLHVTFLDSGESNAVLIRTPAGSTILIDGGQYPTRLLTALGDHLPFWEREIALLVLTQPKNAQLEALPALLERYHVQQIVTNGQTSDADAYLAVQTAIDRQDIPTLSVHAGYTIETSDGVRLEVLHPQMPPSEGSEPNDEGLVLRLTYGEASFLLTPDLSEQAEAELLASGRWLHGSVVQLPAHGSNRVNSPDFLAAVAPQAAVVQAATGNRLDHPSPEVIARLGDTPLYRTDLNGAIEIVTDGQTLWIATAQTAP